MQPITSVDARTGELREGPTDVPRRVDGVLRPAGNGPG